jgi:hypothetical protein
MSDLSHEVQSFAQDHEQEIVRKILADADRFFAVRGIKDFLQKWEEGAKEHGPMTREKIVTLDWGKEAAKELTDLFWYTCLQLLQDSVRRGETVI